MTALKRISSWMIQRAKVSEARSAIDVGWLIDAEEAGLIYSAPERLDAGLAENLHPKSAARCPAVIDLEARQFVIPCPYDITLRLSTQPDGNVTVSDADGDRHRKCLDVAGTCAIPVEIERDTSSPLLPGGAGYLGNLGALADE